MKSEIREASESKFPRLMRCVDEKADIVVLMSDSGVGMIVCVSQKGCEDDRIGVYSDDWDMYCFKDFEGELVLKNT